MADSKVLFPHALGGNLMIYRSPTKDFGDDITPTAQYFPLSLPLRKVGHDKILKTRHFISNRPLSSPENHGGGIFILLTKFPAEPGTSP